MSPADFDAGAAAIRRVHGDMQAFMEALSVRLDGALPGRVAVQRRRDGLFSRTSHTIAITVTLEHWVYTVALEHGHPRCRRAKSVHGVTLGTEELTLAAWLAALNDLLRGLGEQASAAHGALHDFLIA